MSGSTVDWKTVRLGDVVKLKNGYAFKSKDYVTEGTPVIRISDINDDKVSADKAVRVSSEDVNSNFFIEPGDLLIAMSGATTGKTGVYSGTEPVLQNQRVGNFKILDEKLVDRKYRNYFISSLRKDIEAAAYGGAQPNISAKVLDEFEFPLAPMNIQRSIVAEIEKQFSRLDEAVASLKRVKANLKRYKAAVLKAAVEGKLTEEWRKQNPDIEPASKLLERILAERRTKWEEAELAKMKAKGKEPKNDTWKEKYPGLEIPNIGLRDLIPETWRNVAIGQIFEVAVGATPSRREPMYWNGGIPWVSSGEVDFCKITETRETISAEGLANSSTKMNPIGTVLLGMIGEGKTRGQAAILDIEACNNQNSAAIRVSETEVLPMYIYYYLVSQYEETRRRGSGGNQPALNKSRVQQITFPLPPVAEQIRIVFEIERLLSMEEAIFNALEKNSRKVVSCRQAFLARAFAGGLNDFGGVGAGIKK